MNWNIAVGNFFFRYRNTAFPLVFTLAVALLRPGVFFHRPDLTPLLQGLGAVIALAGAAIRLWTIGFEYIERGGKNKQVYASFLAQKGVYGLTRNPMYLGNALIAAGLVLVAGSPLMVGLVLPFFLFVYQAIVAAEEAYLRGRFGERYAQYCAAVPRWWPDLRRAGAAFSGQRYQWRRAIRKDLSTLLGLCTGLIFLPVWRIYGVGGWEAAQASAAHAVLWQAGVFAAYSVLYVCKKRRQFLYAAEEFEQRPGGG